MKGTITTALRVTLVAGTLIAGSLIAGSLVAGSLIAGSLIAESLVVAPLEAQQPGVLPDSSANRFTWRSALLSLAVPGAGQILAGEERGALYLVAEAFLLTRAISERNEGIRERAGYQDLALNVARRAFGGVRTDTVFEYYDKLGKFIETGPFDAIAGGDLEPPVDTLTFNGAIWSLARRTFLQDPEGPFDTASEEYQRAISFTAGGRSGVTSDGHGATPAWNRISSGAAFARATMHFGAPRISSEL